MKIRIAVAVCSDGSWRAAGASSWHDEAKRYEAERHLADSTIRWIEADVPCPQPTTVQGKVVAEIPEVRQ